MKRRKITFGLVLTIAILSLGANIFQFVRYNNDITKVKSPVGTVCDNKIIDKYNEEFLNYTLTQKYEFNVIKDIEKNKDFNKDPNCIAIEYNIEKNKETPDYNLLKKYYEEIKDFSIKNRNPSLNIQGITSLDLLNPGKGKSAGVVSR